MSKRARRTNIIYTETKSTYSSYTCPFCKTTFHGAGINKYIIRFLCSGCNNEIIVNNK